LLKAINNNIVIELANMLVKVIFTRVKQSKSNRINKQIRENKLYLIEY